MDEKVVIGFEEPQTMAQKRKVVLWNILYASAVAGDRLATTMLEPKIEVWL